MIPKVILTKNIFKYLNGFAVYSKVVRNVKQILILKDNFFYIYRKCNVETATGKSFDLESVRSPKV